MEIKCQLRYAVVIHSLLPLHGPFGTCISIFLFPVLPRADCVMFSSAIIQSVHTRAHPSVCIYTPRLTVYLLISNIWGSTECTRTSLFIPLHYVNLSFLFLLVVFTKHRYLSMWDSHKSRSSS
ncbi:unnamed protein product [Calicophoron daubneyi]|uniref:Uncharacterized protein n=1 Tax=Calicophoron daubneyi TaxID=300641 RepID=A0AAV2T1C5_CALDB